MICVTHLPQIGCYADQHIKVAKLASYDRATTSVEVVAGETRAMELSQMLGSDSEVSRSNAIEMLEQAMKWKENRGSAS